MQNFACWSHFDPLISLKQPEQYKICKYATEREFYIKHTTETENSLKQNWNKLPFGTYEPLVSAILDFDRN